MATIGELVLGLKTIRTVGDTGMEVTDIQLDSRKADKGCLFVAMRGNTVDGHQFIDKAIGLGAGAVLCEVLPEQLTDGVTYIQVPDCEDVVGTVATRFFGNPTDKLKLVGVTGTNGKTTIATLLYNMFRKMGYKTGLLSTVCNYIDGEPIPADHTTPDAVTLNRLLGRMADEGCKYVFMECSSHAIVQKRIGGLKYAGGIFTNLTRDHLDYHKTVTYSLRSICDFKGRLLESGFDGMLLEINGREVFLKFIGKFNASNLLAVYGTAVNLGRDPMEVLTVMSTLVPVNGRFDAIRSPKGFTAIVDYAHTPDALTNVLTTIVDVLDGKGQIITVVGAGGNRDKGKRPLMAKESVKYSDRVIITSDNPRFEEPQDIINDMLAGLTRDDMQKVISIADRREAIRTACMMAEKGDVILVAGKGHEDYQEIKGVKHHFDDHEVIRDCF